MAPYWDALVQGMITGVVGAGLLGLLAVSRNRVRDQLLKTWIRRNLEKINPVVRPDSI